MLHESFAHMCYEWFKSTVLSDDVPFRTITRVAHAVLCVKRTQHYLLTECASRRRNAFETRVMVRKGTSSLAPTTVGGTADGTRRSTVGTLNMGTSRLGLVDPWPRLLQGMSPLAPLAMGSSVGHMGSGTIRIRTFLNVHVPMTHTTSLPPS